MARDVASAYAASGAKVASWVVVSAVVFRWSEAAFAALTLVRATLGLLTYTAFGIGPAMVHQFARARQAVSPVRAFPLAEEAPTAAPLTLDYADPSVGRPEDFDLERRRLLAAGLCAAGFAAAFGGLLLAIYANGLQRYLTIPQGVRESDLYEFAVFFGFGIIVRLLSEPASAVLQTEGRIVLDNAILTVAEVAWAAVVFQAFRVQRPYNPLGLVGGCFAFTSFCLLLARMFLADRRVKLPLSFFRFVEARIVRRILGYGLLVTLAQLADFLYAPTDYILISALLNPLDIAAYAPAVQIDAGLLILVTGLAVVLLPKAALAHAADDATAVRRYYVRGTLASAALLALAALAVWALAPRLLTLWLGQDVPATRAILPGILVHTVVGGSGAVGRSVLIGVGRVRAFTISVLVAGVANVILSAAFVWLGLGLWGIVLGTISVVVARCGLWMPWYVLRVLGEAKGNGTPK